MKLVVDFFDLQKLPQYLKKSSNQRQISLYIRCPFDVAFVCDDVYDDVTKLTKNYNADISLVFVVENYNIDINTLTKLKTFSKKKGINVFLEDKYEISENYYEEDYISLEQAIEAIKKLDDGDELILENRVYNFYPDFAFEKEYLFLTDSTSLKKCVFLLRGKKNITIDGNGAELIFHGEIVLFAVDGCENVIIKNCIVDYASPFFSQADIIEADEKHAVLKFDTSETQCGTKNGRQSKIYAKIVLDYVPVA